MVIDSFGYFTEWDEKELDSLILSAKSKRMSTYLQTLKETMADPSEALRLRWIDISGNVIMINRPVKGHHPDLSKSQAT